MDKSAVVKATLLHGVLDNHLEVMDDKGEVMTIRKAVRLRPAGGLRNVAGFFKYHYGVEEDDAKEMAIMYQTLKYQGVWNGNTKGY